MGYALIYDKAGVADNCVAATYKQIGELIDDRSYRVECLSKVPNALSDTSSNPVRLFVIPGGNYTHMADELRPLAGSIRKLVLEEGASYLGICAGAIAATCRPMLILDKMLVPDQPHPLMQQIKEWPRPAPVYLQLYAGNCCYLYVPKGMTCGTQRVRKVFPKVDQSSFPLYFQSGVFFPNAMRQTDARILLEYASYKFSAMYSPPAGPGEFYRDTTPIAAVTQKVGNGRLLLSGVHPEIGPEEVKHFPVMYDYEVQAQAEVVASLNSSTAAQRDTMRDYLDALSIPMKKV